ncbi:MAG: hypothetical protein GY708_14380, partial [Actinomycetia bacterium]|nr:hypothetical protein [Actinomycetes bacterium]
MKSPTVKATTVSAIVPLLPLALLAAVLGCADQEKVDTGGVALQVQFVNTPFQVGVNDDETLSLPQIEITSILTDPNGATSDLMNVQLDLYEVTYTRGDTGTRVPTPYVSRLSRIVPVGGSLILTNFPVMTSEQLRSPPLSDLLFENGGFDKETGNTSITIDIRFVLFGKTLAGREVTSVPR